MNKEKMKETKKSIFDSFIIEQQGGVWRLCYHMPEEEAGVVGAPIGFALGRTGLELFFDARRFEGEELRDAGKALELKIKTSGEGHQRQAQETERAEDWAACAGVMLNKGCLYVELDDEGLWFRTEADARRAQQYAADALYDFKFPKEESAAPAAGKKSAAEANETKEDERHLCNAEGWCFPMEHAVKMSHKTQRGFCVVSMIHRETHKWSQQLVYRYDKQDYAPPRLCPFCAGNPNAYTQKTDELET